MVGSERCVAGVRETSWGRSRRGGKGVEEIEPWTICIYVLI